MKKIITLLISMLPALLIAQSNRMVLAEHFTSATCGPCAAQNPAFDALLHANADKITSIKYHMSWPSPGNDPMYLHNPLDNNARRTYYNVNAVPHVVIGGNIYTGSPGTVNQTRIDTWASDPSPFDIDMQHWLSANQDSVYVVMLIKANQAVGGNLVAHIAVIEKEIHYATPPGTNGEKDFYNVMKALIPSRSGTSLPSFQEGDYVIVEAAWQLQNVYNTDQIAAVGFVQNNSDKVVHQAANSSEDAIQPLYAHDAVVQNIENATAINCSGTMEPVAVIGNYGSATLTQATVAFKVNGQTLKTIEWSGNLSFLETVEVDAGLIEFALLEENELEVEITAVNGLTDEYPINNTYTMPFVISPDVPQPPSLFILLDDNPEEITWELRNSSGEIVDSGGPYTTPNAIISQTLQVTSVGCYTFTIFDSGGNGLCCSHGIGYYALLNGNNPLITGQDFGEKEINQLYYGYVGLEQAAENISVKMLPNPAKNEVTIQLGLTVDSNIEIQLTDLQGRKVLEQSVAQLSAGKQKLALDVSTLHPGMYLVNITINGRVISQKLLVE